VSTSCERGIPYDRKRSTTARAPSEPTPSRARLTWTAIAIGIVAVVIFGVSARVVHNTAENAKGSATASSNQAQSLAQQVAAACAQGGPVAAQLGAACEKIAADIKSTPAPPPADGAKGDQGVPGLNGLPARPDLLAPGENWPLRSTGASWRARSDRKVPGRLVQPVRMELRARTG